jgi:tRNA(Ile)-lysidine synthase
MLDAFIGFIEEKNLLAPGSRTLLAVSGGLDSVVMADLFRRAGLNFDMAHVNFHLRGEESDRDEQFVRELAGKYRVQVFVRHVETAKYARQHKISIQVAARNIRYRWFDELLMDHAYDQVGTAHHLDDQVETFLINLARGTGIAGLHGIPVKSEKIIRPLLFATRDEIETYAKTHHLDFVEDSSNSSMKYTRNRIRHKIIPQLEKINPGFKEDINNTIGFIHDAETIYRQAIEQKKQELFILKNDQVHIPAEQFFNLKPLETWAYELLSPYGFNLSAIKDVIGLKKAIAGKEVVSVTHRLVRDRDHLIMVPLLKAIDNKIYFLTAAGLHRGLKSPVHLSFEILGETPEKYGKPETTAYVDMEKLEFPLQVRKWKRGDYFFPLGMEQRKKLSDFFIDLKFTKIEKENQWLLCSGIDIVWIIGKRIDDRYKITAASKTFLKITTLSGMVI